MPFPAVLRLLDYWRQHPPLPVLVELLLGAFTTWRPGERHPRNAEEHRASLEERWRAGAMNPKQMMEALGGGLFARASTDPADLPGIGRFPGAPAP